MTASLTTIHWDETMLRQLKTPERNPAQSIKACSVPGCGGAGQLRRGLCDAHYRKWKRYGDPEASYQSKLLDFVRHAASYSGDQCLIWPFATNTHGYGQVRFRGAQAPAHRVVCELAHGPAPTPDHHAAHDNNGVMCVSRSCVNPNHLRWATPLENEADKTKHGGIVRGERHGRSKLTEQQVQEIRLMRGKAETSDLAERYSVSVRTIRSIHSGEKWGWLPVAPGAAAETGEGR